MRKFFLILMVIFLSAPVFAREIAGVAVEEEIVNDGGTTLMLNGAGIRKKVFFSIYIAELYLEKREADVAKVMADEGARRVVMHFLYDKVGKEKLVDGWNTGFSSNLDEAALKSFQPRIDALNGMFNEDMVEGDRVIFDYIPGRGTVVNIKGSERGVIEGKDFNDALLAIWLGKKPVSSDLKSALLKAK